VIDQFSDAVEVTATTLDVSDCLLRLGDVHYPRAYDPTQPPVVVASARPPEAPSADAAQAPDLIEVVTSAGSFYTTAETPAWVQRSAAVDPDTILLISRRAALHSALCAQGFQIQRRTPVTFDNTAHPVTATEWNTAALVVIDGFLLGESVAALWQRGDLDVRPGIVLLCTDPDDARTDALAYLARAGSTVVLPYDTARLLSMFRAAHGDEEARLLHPDVFPYDR
jgi:hypothetical protein